jgi:hypothetical protein
MFGRIPLLFSRDSMCGAKFVRAPRVHGFLNLLNHDNQRFPAVLRSMAHKKLRDLTIILLAWKITCLSLVLEEHCSLFGNAENFIQDRPGQHSTASRYATTVRFVARGSGFPAPLSKGQPVFGCL